MRGVGLNLGISFDLDGYVVTMRELTMMMYWVGCEGRCRIQLVFGVVRSSGELEEALVERLGRSRGYPSLSYYHTILYWLDW